jgi:hypothetical protein
MEAVIETHLSGSRFWLQGADGEALQLRIADCGLWKPECGVGQPKLINSERPIPDFLIS